MYLASVEFLWMRQLLGVNIVFTVTCQTLWARSINSRLCSVVLTGVDTFSTRWWYICLLPSADRTLPSLVTLVPGLLLTSHWTMVSNWSCCTALVISTCFTIHMLAAIISLFCYFVFFLSSFSLSGNCSLDMQLYKTHKYHLAKDWERQSEGEIERFLCEGHTGCFRKDMFRMEGENMKNFKTVNVWIFRSCT